MASSTTRGATTTSRRTDEDDGVPRGGNDWQRDLGPDVDATGCPCSGSPDRGGMLAGAAIGGFGSTFVIRSARPRMGTTSRSGPHLFGFRPHHHQAFVSFSIGMDRQDARCRRAIVPRSPRLSCRRCASLKSHTDNDLDCCILLLVVCCKYGGSG